MNKFIVLAFTLLLTKNAEAQTYRFDFSAGKKTTEGFTCITLADTFTLARGYGYDLVPVPKSKTNKPFFFSINVPDGNYRVTATLGSPTCAGTTVIRGESRRLFFEQQQTSRGEQRIVSFTVNKRTPHITATEMVKIKSRERFKLNWDDKLTLEFNGDAPALTRLVVERDEEATTVFLCGNSTVVDQDNEPWASWGQMIPRFFTSNVCFANYAESGESANTFIGSGRLKKALTQMKNGDFLFIEFGHNDQKQHGPGKGAYYSFATSLKIFIDEARSRGVTPVLITPTQRRSFDALGKIKDTHENYPEAMRWLAAKENVPLIDLNERTRTLYEALGVDESKHAFVHYPAGSYPGQTTALADNTHFTPYGAYEIAKCVIEGIKHLNLPLVKHLRNDYVEFLSTHPDARSTFRWMDSPFTEITKPDGN